MGKIAVLSLCVHRTVSIPTFVSAIQLVTDGPGWDIQINHGDALISRVRSIAATQWLNQYKMSDVLVMCDDDFQFTPTAINALVALTREKKAIVAGVTPLRGGRYTAIVPLDGSLEEPWIDEQSEPQEIRYAGGLIAYHRSVFETLAQNLPILHTDDVIPEFYPFFMPVVMELNGRLDYLSEDYSCHERARRAGFKVWVQPKCQVGHIATVMLTADKMDKMKDF